MAKRLSDILAAHGINTIPSGVFPRLPEQDLEAKNEWKQKSPDAQDFVDKHEIKHVADRNDNKDDVFTASNITPIDRPSTRHGYNPKDEYSVYEDQDYDNDADDLNVKIDTKKLEPKLKCKWGCPEKFQLFSDLEAHAAQAHGKELAAIRTAMKSHYAGITARSMREETLEEELLNETVPSHYVLQKFGYRRMGREGEWTKWTEGYGRGNSSIYVNEDGINWSHDIEDKKAVASGKGPATLKQRLEEFHPVKKKIEEDLDEFLETLNEEDFVKVMTVIEQGSTKEVDELVDFLNSQLDEDLGPNAKPAPIGQKRIQATSQSKPSTPASNANMKPATVTRTRNQANSQSKPKPLSAGDFEDGEQIEEYELEESRKKIHGYKKYDIYIGGKLIDSVSHDTESSDIVRKHLINKSGFDSNIVVRRHR